MNILTTGIGSLPIHSMDDAWHYARTAYDLPFLPQPALDQEDAGMVAEVLPGSLRRDAGAPFSFLLVDRLDSPEMQLPWQEQPTEHGVPLLRRVRDMGHLVPRDLPHGLKLQMAGPVSLLQTLKDCLGRPLWVSHALRDAVMGWCKKTAQAIFSRLAPRATPLVLWLDEPLLGLLPPGPERDRALEMAAALCHRLKDLGFRPGIHCCSAPPFELLPLLPDGCDFSFDLVRFKPSEADILERCRPFLIRQGRLALGVMAPLGGADGEEELQVVPRIMERLHPEPQTRYQRFLLTPSCGTMLTPLSREQKISHLLRLWSQQWSQ